MNARARVRVLKAVVWLICLAPVGQLVLRFFDDQFGADPVDTLTYWSGRSAILLLLGALAITPVRRLTGWNDLQKVRRLVGLFAFTYATLHLLVYVGLDRFGIWDVLFEDVAERPFITVGFVAYLVLLALAITSTRGWIRRLGKRWQRLHRLVYLAGVLACIHFYWALKADFFWPLMAATTLVVLLLFRVPPLSRLRLPFGRSTSR